MNQLSNNTVATICRTWAPGDSFNWDRFRQNVAMPIIEIMKSSSVDMVVPVICGDLSLDFAEKPVNRVFRTVKAFEQMFSDLIGKKIFPLVIHEGWGQNIGSTQAINQGILEARKYGDPEWVMPYSPDLLIANTDIDRALRFAEGKELAFVGFLRERWEERRVWAMAQNTGTIYRTSVIDEIGGFNPRCDGRNEHIEITIKGPAPIPELDAFYSSNQGVNFQALVAGMDDAYLQFNLFVKKGFFLRWGMVGKESPHPWKVYSGPDAERTKNQAIKICRQSEVTRIYCEELLPDQFAGDINKDQVFEEFMNMFFSNCHMI